MATTTTGTGSTASTTPQVVSTPVVRFAPLAARSHVFFPPRYQRHHVYSHDSGASQHLIDSNLLPNVEDFMHHHQDLRSPLDIEAAGGKFLFEIAAGVKNVAFDESSLLLPLYQVFVVICFRLERRRTMERLRLSSMNHTLTCKKLRFLYDPALQSICTTPTWSW